MNLKSLLVNAMLILSSFIMDLSRDFAEKIENSPKRCSGNDIKRWLFVYGLFLIARKQLEKIFFWKKFDVVFFLYYFGSKSIPKSVDFFV